MRLFRAGHVEDAAGRVIPGRAAAVLHGEDAEGVVVPGGEFGGRQSPPRRPAVQVGIPSCNVAGAGIARVTCDGRAVAIPLVLAGRIRDPRLSGG